jgi:hypothetical protein
MKKFIAIVALLTAVATPAFAQSSYRDNGRAAFAQAPQNYPTDISRNPAVDAWTDHGDLGSSVHNGYVVDGY